MKVLIIGNGGRENALSWKIRQSPSVEHCQMVPAEPKEDLLATALSGGYDLTVVGPEEPLNDGIVDLFKARGLRVFGPSQAGAKLESSKVDAKIFMEKYGIKTAPYEVFDDFYASTAYLRRCRFPLVIKADGLANGKGVVICHTFEEGEKALEDLMVRKQFNQSGERVIIETFLEGFEASMLCITDGVRIKPFISAMDYKRAEDHNRGLNTGGMGAVAPNPFLTRSHLEVFEKEIMEKTLNGIKNEKIDYHGFLYFGLMVTAEDIFVLEYNVRLGDPETQAVLPLMKSDLVDVMLATLDEELEHRSLAWLDKRSCCVVACSGGYPQTFQKHKKITGLERVENNLFLSGVYQKDGEYSTNAGRVLSINAVDDSLENARARCYKDLQNISFEGMYYRKDIGKIEEGGK
ncbi:MAG TPA: phosphoribosylamine--glycine ligase [Thermotogota bacterium]|nr:phosphoribosylamine--glycine ligase [Thermotogota bacterium]